MKNLDPLLITQIHKLQEKTTDLSQCLLSDKENLSSLTKNSPILKDLVHSKLDQILINQQILAKNSTTTKKWWSVEEDLKLKDLVG